MLRDAPLRFAESQPRCAGRKRRTQRKERINENMHENDIAKIIVDAAYKVHTRLGLGLLESANKVINGVFMPFLL